MSKGSTLAFQGGNKPETIAPPIPSFLSPPTSPPLMFPVSSKGSMSASDLQMCPSVLSSHVASSGEVKELSSSAKKSQNVQRPRSHEEDLCWLHKVAGHGIFLREYRCAGHTGEHNAQCCLPLILM